MSSAEFTQWIAYANQEPFGNPLEMWMHGVRASSIVNAIYSTVPTPKGHPRPKRLTPQDFYPMSKGREPDLTPEQREYIKKKRSTKVTKVKK